MASSAGLLASRAAYWAMRTSSMALPTTPSAPIAPILRSCPTLPAKSLSLSRLNLRLDASLAQRLLDSQFDRVLPNGAIALSNHDHLAHKVSAFLGQWVDDLVVNVV